MDVVEVGGSRWMTAMSERAAQEVPVNSIRGSGRESLRAGCAQLAP
jgi:hypothetical protein